MSRHRALFVAVATLSTVLWTFSCGDGGTEPPPPDPPRPTTVTVTPASSQLTALDATVQLRAEVLDQNGQVMANATVNWSSSAAAVAAVDGSGLVTAAGNGAATITATASEASGEALVTVMQSAASVVVTRPVDTIAPADTLRFAADAYDLNGHRVEGAEFTWSSSEVTVATVDASGLVQGVGEGVATITATAGSAQGTAEITVENPDRAVLAALYHATDGPNWVNNDGWLTDAPLGDWYGVDTDRFGRVVRLNLSSRWDPEAQEIVRQGLSGPIPVELASLAHLELLDFWFNNLTGPIPSELGSLTNLRVLWLSSNSLSGPIPPELGNLANLRGLSLGGNALTGAIPPELGGLSGLTELHLGGAALTGPIPSELGSLTNLTELYLDGNALTGPIPSELGNLANLRRLELSRNGFVSLPPGVFGKLSHLSELHLAKNKLDSLPPGTFLGLSSLRILDLEGNPGSPFRLTLELVRTDNDTLDAPGPARITAQVAEGAPFAMPIPLLVEGGDLSADTLTLGVGSASSAEVTVTRNEAGAGGTLVTAGPAPAPPEDIRGIEIELADPLLLFKPTAPTVSFASRARSAPEGDSVVLEVVLGTPAESPVILTYSVGVDDDPETDDADASDYSHGATGSIEIAAGASGASFDIPLADDDDIEPTREVFSVTLDPPGEETGYVRGYPYTAAVTIEEGVCDRTPRIRDEIVAAAGTADCARTDDKDLAGITRLDIRGSSSVASGILWTWELAARIRRGECEPGTWGVEGTGAATTEATACDSEGGGTESPTTDPRRGSDSGGDAITLREGDFAGLSNLGVLYLLRLGLTELPQGVFAGLDRLSWLSLQFNELTNLPPGVFSDLTNLWDGLILANNRLASFPEGVFSPLTDVGLLILEYNQLFEVPAGAFAGLSGVDWLFLNGNRVTGLPAGVFSDMSGLAVLNLASNRLSALPDRPFESLANLSSLYLGDNLLTSVPPRAFAGLSGLRRLGLDRNGMTDLPRGVFSTLPGLTRLWLTGNPLGALQPSDFSDLTNLVDLYLNNVGLSELSPGLFSELAELETLDLRFNQLNELQAGAFLGLHRLKRLGLEGNPGSPFPLTLEPRRTDTSNLLAPGPATVGVGLAQGAPLNLTIGLTVHGGDISVSTVVLEAGSAESDEVTVTRPSDSQSGAQVVAGPAPSLPNGVSGIELLVADPLVLFATVSNLAPVPERSVPFLRMRVGDEPHSVDVSTHFRDPDGDDLTFTASSESPDVATATASGSRVTVVPVGAGSARLTVTATDPGGLSAQTSFPVTVRGAIPGSFDIDLFLIDEVSRSIHDAFDDAVEYWSAILAGTELPDVPLEAGFQLGCWDITTQQTLPSVDELVIVASVREIDGRFGILASAGFCGTRDGEGGLPFMGAMEFDVDDLEWLEENGDMEEVILHEMGHVLGIGTAWRRFGLLVNPSVGNPGADTHFPGPLTIEAFDSAGGTNYTGGAKVPVENRAGPGSGDAHWRESVLDHELMTPFQNGGVLDPLSAITIQSLADLGYTVDAGLAEAYRLPGTADVAEPARKIPYGDDILRGPIIVVDRTGRVVRVIPNLPP